VVTREAQAIFNMSHDAVEAFMAKLTESGALELCDFNFEVRNVTTTGYDEGNETVDVVVQRSQRRPAA